MVNLAELERFYKFKNIQSGCPTCGRSSWVLADAPDAQTTWSLASVREDGNAVFPSPAVPVIAMVCGHCFTLRTHASLPIREWLKANRT